MTHFRSAKCMALAAAALAAALVHETPAHAHNDAVHVAMTDFAYETMLLGERQATGRMPPAVHQVMSGVDQAKYTALFEAMAASVRKLQGLPSGLPQPKDARCNDPQTISEYGVTPISALGGGTVLADVPLGSIPFPVATTYIEGSDCGVQPGWKPGGIFNALNCKDDSGEAKAPCDYTGVTLGFWSMGPDHELDDVHVWVRPTNAGTFTFIKKAIVVVGGVAAGTVWIPVRCALRCAESIFEDFPNGCTACLKDALTQAKDAVSGEVAAADDLIGLGLGGADKRGGIFTGMSHHIDSATWDRSRAPWSPLSLHYDDRGGLLTERAGPFGVPDQIELAAMMGSDMAGVSVHYDTSLAPKNYEISTDLDGHTPSVHRGRAEWQFLGWPHIPFSPVDNLGMFGWQQMEAHAGGVGSFAAPMADADRDRTKIAYRLGWGLHALGDATVPMHAATTFGWGHRPWEDAQENILTELLYLEDATNAAGLVQQVLDKALDWRTFVLDWRATHPGAPNETPVREMVTRMADKTMALAMPNASLVFDPNASSLYATGLGAGAANAMYEARPWWIYRELLAEGIAAELVYLIGVAEVMP